MRIGVIADWLNPNIEDMVARLRARRVDVDVLYPEQHLFRLADVRVVHDLYLLKSGADVALSLAGALHSLGTCTLNPYPTVVTLRNKILVTRILQAAGIPTPDTYVTARTADLLPLFADGALILKPYRGSRGEGIRIVETPDDLPSEQDGEPLVVQRFHPSDDGRDLKIFRIGDQLFGQRRIWPLRSYADKLGEPCALTKEQRAIALACGEAFGIDLYGLDMVISDGHPYVVDVNKFGSYMGVPDAAELLAQYIHQAGKRAAAITRRRHAKGAREVHLPSQHAVTNDAASVRALSETRGGQPDEALLHARV
jgi:ribosomal protein S6--L-glutamate ligase